MRLADYYLDHLLEPDMPIMHERRALRRHPEPRTYDVEREAEYRQRLDWQWQIEQERKEDERIEKQYDKEGGV